MNGQALCELPMNKPFTVVMLSDNANSFGLKGMIVMADDGEAWELAANAINVRQTGQVIQVPVVNDKCEWAGMGFELPRRLPTAPPIIVQQFKETLCGVNTSAHPRSATVARISPVAGKRKEEIHRGVRRVVRQLLNTGRNRHDLLSK